MRRDPAFKHDHDQRCRHHGERDNQTGDIGDMIRQDLHPDRIGQQDEAEFTALGQREGEKPAGMSANAEDQGQPPQDHALYQDQRQDQAQDERRCLRQQGKLHPRPDRNEEDPEQQSLEGFQHADQFVAVFAVGQHDTGQESPQCSREADPAHQQRGRYHQQE